MSLVRSMSFGQNYPISVRLSGTQWDHGGTKVGASWDYGGSIVLSAWEERGSIYGAAMEESGICSLYLSH